MNSQDPFEPYPDPGPCFKGMRVYSIYIQMRDGTRLAADIYLPLGLPSGERIPTLLYQTRYQRSVELRPPLSWLFRGEGDVYPATRRGKSFFVSRGYAMVMVDVRGTGASFGVCRYPWEAVTVDDARDILDWIVQQPWSNGRVAGMGLSFLGTTAELLLATRHPAVAAVIPQFNHPDPYTDIAMPGGLYNERFVQAWTALNEALDRNQSPAIFGRMMKLITQGVRPVGGAGGRRELLEAVRMHAGNGGLKDLDVEMAFRDEVHPLAGYSIDDQSVMRFRDAVLESRVPVYGWASWMDAGTANAALRRFLTLSGPQLAVIGAWNHGGLQQSSPYQPAGAALSPTPAVQRREILRFLDTCLRSPDGSSRLENTVYYYTLGAERWQKSTTWPPPGIRQERWYLAGQHTLASQLPAETGEDAYSVDFRASSGPQSRWWELGVIQRKTVDLGDRAAQKPFVLGYESAPLDRDVEISGTPVVTLHVACSAADCAFFVYLEDVFPDGHIVCLTEGQLRAIHRRVCPPEESVYNLQSPYHTFRAEDALPLVPGEVAEISFGLLPVSALVQGGHRLRIAIAGSDAGNFKRLPPQGEVHWTIARGPRYPSSLSLPLK